MLDTVNVFYNLHKGEMFGQVALTNNASHEFSVRAAVYSELLTLDRESYEELAGGNDKFAELVEMEVGLLGSRDSHHTHLIRLSGVLFAWYPQAIKQEQTTVRAQKVLREYAELTRVGTEKGMAGEDPPTMRGSMAGSARFSFRSSSFKSSSFKSSSFKTIPSSASARKAQRPNKVMGLSIASKVFSS
jgi:CRP-like cAMP-binding protein